MASEFRFDFQNNSKSNNTDDENDTLVTKSSREIKLNVSSDVLARRNSMEILARDYSVPSDVRTIKKEFCGVKLTVLEHRSLEIYLTKQDFADILEAVSLHVDLAPGLYEGGFKEWECGTDLARFICEQNIDFTGKHVIELGCGSGFPGLCAIKKNAKSVHFQDYNVEVVEHLTVRNVLLNRDNDCECRFFSGDWRSVVNVISPSNEKPRCYDIILTAETIYNPDNYEILVKVFDDLLTATGVIYLSAKSNYFGVGGGTRLFEDYLISTNLFTSDVYHRITANVPREILKIGRKT